MLPIPTSRAVAIRKKVEDDERKLRRSHSHVWPCLPSQEIAGKDARKRIGIEEQEAPKSVTRIPVWDAERRELRVNGDVVKQFKWSAANQEAILSAFEEERWPAHIDDPLPPHAEQDSKRRLSDTIKCLNRKQQHPLIHFRGDGTGEGVVWEFVEPRE